MKVAICGVQGTGKTTKVFEIAKELKYKNKDKKVGIVQENAIDCPYPINENTISLSQYWLVCDQVKKELEYSKKYDIVICDRTIFDPICYCYAASVINEIKIEKDVLETTAKILYDFTKNLGYTYDKIYLMNGNNNFYNYSDGIRSVNLEFRNIVNNYFLDVFYDLYSDGYIKDYEII